MTQLVELQEYDAEFRKRGVQLVALSYEELNQEAHAQIRRKVRGESPLVLADIGNREATAYDRTTAYLIDGGGLVQRVMPMETYSRAPVWALLNEIDKVFKRP